MSHGRWLAFSANFRLGDVSPCCRGKSKFSYEKNDAVFRNSFISGGILVIVILTLPALPVPLTFFKRSLYTFSSKIATLQGIYLLIIYL